MKEITVEVMDIAWDDAPEELPTTMEVVITEDDVDDLEDLEEVIEVVSDRISDESGFCHNGFATNLDELLEA